MLTPDEFATFMADVVAANPDNPVGAHVEGVRLMGALLADLGYAEGVLIFNEMSTWYDDPNLPNYGEPVERDE